MKVKSESEVAQLCPTVGDPMDCSLPGFSVQEIFQARALEWVAVAFSGFHDYYPIIMNRSWECDPPNVFALSVISHGVSRKEE